MRPEPHLQEEAVVSECSKAGPPKVSVIVRVFERREYIGEAIESVLAQTYPHVEIIVVDNGSSTPVKDVLDPYGQKIRYVYKARGSVGSAANVGVGYATGEFVAFLDDDDLWEPRMLEEAVSVLLKDARVDVAWVGWEVFHHRDRETRFEPTEAPFLRDVQAGMDVLGVLCQLNVIPMCSAVTRRAAILQSNGFDESLLYGEEWDLWLRIIQNGGRVVHVPKPYYLHRRHSRNVTERSIPLCRSDIALLKKVLSYVGSPYRPLVKRSLAERHRRLGELFWQVGHRLRGTGSVVYSLVVNPLDRNTAWYAADWIIRKIVRR